MDESNSPFATASAKRFGGADGQNGISDDDFGESSLKHSINGEAADAWQGLSQVDGFLRDASIGRLQTVVKVCSKI